MSRLTTLAGVVVVGLLGVGLWYWIFERGHHTVFRTAPIEKGNLVVTVSATGTLEPLALVDIGAQVQGQIIEFGKDPKSKTGFIDWNSQVEENTVLAKIDDSLYQAAAATARASLQKATSEIPGLEARMRDAQSDFERSKMLLVSDADSVQRYEKYKANYDAAVANLAAGRAAVLEAKANLQRAEVNVGYCTIKSPTKGVVVDRRVNVGQTVVSSLNAPSLFLIAKDLSDMQVWASVNEADVGKVFPGQKVRFTVMAFPREIFQGVVAARGVRRNASMTQNVVTYTVVVDIINPSKKLQPYMTANMLFEVARKDNVLKVPNAALRWRPDPHEVAPAQRAEFLKARLPDSDDEDDFGAGSDEADSKGTVWVVDGNFVKPVHVKLGLNNGTSTEVVSGDVAQNTGVVVGIVEQKQTRGGNPFIPKRSE